MNRSTNIKDDSLPLIEEIANELKLYGNDVAVCYGQVYSSVMFHYDGKIGSVAVWGGVLYWRRRFGEDKSYEVIPDSNLSIYEQAEQVLAMPITDRNGEPVKECGSLEDLVNNPYFKGIYTIV